uniref:Uncharacterized protein n=1 Tax=Anguilla anguilla TaxID=7936 RepID=A0A0E9R9K2_ANGAN
MFRVQCSLWWPLTNNLLCFLQFMCIILAYFQTDFVLKVVNPFPLDI